MDDLIEAVIELAGDILEAIIKHNRNNDAGPIRRAWYRMSSGQKWLAAFICPLLLILGIGCILYVLLAQTDPSTRTWGIVAGVMLALLSVFIIIRCFHSRA